MISAAAAEGGVRSYRQVTGRAASPRIY